MTYDAATNTSQEEHDNFINELSEVTLAAIVAANGNEAALKEAVRDFFVKATEANLELEEIEDILGVDEDCIMNQAELSEADEDVVIDTFDALVNDLIETYKDEQPVS
jgi:hypothetical protein